MKPIPPVLKPTKEEKPKSYPYATEASSWWNQKRQQRFALMIKEKVASSIEVPEKMKPMWRSLKSCSG